MAGWADQRPMSPHLQVWRWHATMAASIGHRMTGIILYTGAAALTVWLCAIAAGPEAYDALIGLVPGWAIWALLYAVTGVIAFHFANGVRHFFFDLGKGFLPKTADRTAWFVFLFTIAAPAGLYFLLHA